MPSLFNRRSRSVSTSRPTTPASSSAHMAAAQAFLASQPSQSNLSTSAAAAALRSMSPPPVAVDQVQTKRMLNRQASNSSVGSASRGRSRGTVQRRPSAGSMTERTFRTSSPAQPGSPNTGAVGTGRGAPPVPPVPQTYTDDLPPLPPKAHRRSASMDTPPLATGSPPVTRSAGRGQNVTQVPNVSNLAAAAARKSTNSVQAPPMQRSDSQESRNSINFSYPRGSRPNSPPPRSPLASSEALPIPATNGISAAETARIQRELIQTASVPVKKKKKRVDPSAAEGSHLQSGTMGGKPKVTPLAPLPADYVPPPIEPVKKTKKAPALTGQSSHFPSHDEEPQVIESAADTSKSVEPVIEKRTQRASGLLAKQPSVVREDWEGEQEAKESSPIEAVTAESVKSPSSHITEPFQSKKVAPEANMSRKIEDPSAMIKPQSSTHDNAASSTAKFSDASQALSPKTDEVSAGRGISISPSRSTRFSDRLASDLASGRKHEPLGRSISPAKSALKHSAGSDASPTDAKFPGRRGSSVTPSEASDASDGRSGRKKSVRVSFDAPAESRDTGTTTRSSRDAGRKSFLSAGTLRTSTRRTSDSDDEVEEGMKPRPALPSFGSVRRNDRSSSPGGKTSETPERTSGLTKSSSSSETSSIADPPTMNTSISSDHALGGLIYKDSQKNAVPTSDRKTIEPQLPTQIPAESAGYESDTDSVYSDDDQPFQAAQAASQRLSKGIGSASAASAKDTIPIIAVQPATPGIDESRQPGEDWAVDVPGGFPVSGASSNISLQDNVENTSTSTTPVRANNGLGLSGTVHEYTNLISHDSPLDSSPQQLMTIEEEDSDASVYSDAAEDLSDLEGDGFGSINAIVESPAVTSPVQRGKPIPESPLAALSQRKSTDVEDTPSWDNTQSHWSNVAQRSRDTPQPVAKPSVVSANAQVTSSAASIPATNIAKPTTMRKTMKQASPSNAPVATKPASTRVPMAPATPTAALRTPEQTPPTSVVATKQVGPAKPQAQLRSSMRGQAEPIAGPAKTRPASYAGPSTTPRAALQKKHIPPAAAVPPANVRRFSNDSDSDSSFKRTRRNRKPAEGGFTMRRSMRTGPTEPEKPSLPTGRGGIRSLSPPTDRRPTSPTGVKPMRLTMRGSFDQGTPTLRAQPERKRSSSWFSSNRKAKSPTRPSTSSSAIPSKIRSRITDSDDEDGPRPAHFKSRFADSSDEDEPNTLRPVRGIPRRKDEGDSTDLDDSSDDQGRKNKIGSPKKLTIVPPPASQDISSPPQSPTTAKKRGFWSRLRGKKKDEELDVSAPQTIAQREGIKDEIEAGKKEIRDSKQLGFNSAAEKEAMIEQTRLKLEAAKETPQSPIARPQSPPGKLQRRITPQRVFSDSWAQPKIPAATDDRPATSSGADDASRPAIGSRQPTSEAVNGEVVENSTSGKKKRFGKLRRAFGLTD